MMEQDLLGVVRRCQRNREWDQTTQTASLSSGSFDTFGRRKVSSQRSRTAGARSKMFRGEPLSCGDDRGRRGVRSPIDCR